MAVPQMRTWLVNQNQTFRQEQAGGHLWSPKRKANNHRNHRLAFHRDDIFLETA